MRFMVLVKASKDSEAGVLPTEQELVEMGRFNDELVKAGVMLAGEGLQPTSKGARIKFGPKGKEAVTDGPFAETKEQLAGFYMIEARDLNEAIRIAARIPGAARGCVEIRPVAEDTQTIQALGFDRHT